MDHIPSGKPKSYTEYLRRIHFEELSEVNDNISTDQTNDSSISYENSELDNDSTVAHVTISTDQPEDLSFQLSYENTELVNDRTMTDDRKHVERAENVAPTSQKCVKKTKSASQEDFRKVKLNIKNKPYQKDLGTVEQSQKCVEKTKSVSQKDNPKVKFNIKNKPSQKTSKLSKKKKKVSHHTDQANAAE